MLASPGRGAPAWEERMQDHPVKEARPLVQAGPAKEAGSDVARGANSHAVRDVLIIDDHPLMCDALAVTLGHAFGLARVRQAATLAAGRDMVRRSGPDAILLDLNLPDAAGIEGVLALRQVAGAVPIAVISADEEAGVIAGVIAAGARGYLSKTMPRAHMVQALERIWSGEVVWPEGHDPSGPAATEAARLAASFATLTPQQMNILRLICQGRPNKIISYELSIAEATVKTHIAAIMEKIHVSNRTQAALLANRARVFQN